MKLLANIMDGPGQLRLAAIHAVQQKLTHSGTVVRQKLTQRTMIGGLVRVIAPKRLRFGRKFQHIFGLVWSQLPVTATVEILVEKCAESGCVVGCLEVVQKVKGKGGNGK